MIAARCSSLPLLARCAAAGVDPQVRVESAGDDARLGTAVHECLRLALEGEDWDADMAAAYYCAPGCGEEVRALTLAGLACWEQLRGYFPVPECEAELNAEGDGWKLTGHADVISLVEIES